MPIIATQRRLPAIAAGTRRNLAGSLARAIVGMTLLGAAALPSAPGGLQYDAAGRLAFPADYRGWVFLSSGIDMSYTQSPAMASGHMFNNVFVPRPAYNAFMATGAWPDGTILVLENRGGATDVSINKRGVVQTQALMGVEAHVKDTVRFKGGWGFFAFDGETPAERIPTTESCYSCHQTHAAVDTTFVQFYPTLLPIAASHKTLSAAYLSETSQQPGSSDR